MLRLYWNKPHIDRSCPRSEWTNHLLTPYLLLLSNSAAKNVRTGLQ